MVTASGLRATSGRKRFSLSWKRLVARSATRVVTPYGPVRVGAYGREAVRGFGDYAGLFYETASGSSYGRGVLLRAPAKTYYLPTGPGWLLGSGRTLHWSVLTHDGNFYQVKSFAVRWRYYVLR